MASAPKTDAPGNRLFILALGLLVGFVVGFVLLLSRLPAATSLNHYAASEIKSVIPIDRTLEFYDLLPKQTVAQKAPTVRDVTPAKKVIPPATRVVPGNVQRLNPRNLATESYAEIPATSLGQESYYLQAGNYRQPEDAERARAAVLLLGLEAFIVVRQDSSGAAGHRVRIGPFFDQAKITDVKKRLHRGGIDYKLIRVTG